MIDTIMKIEGLQALKDKLGLVEAERFIMLIQRDTFDYTKWQQNLFDNMSIEEITEKAKNYINENNLDYNL